MSRAASRVDIVMPYSLAPSAKGKDSPHRVEARQTIGLGPMRASEPLLLVVQRMVETIFMGMMATLFGIILSIPFSFLGGAQHHVRLSAHRWRSTTSPAPS